MTGNSANDETRLPYVTLPPSLSAITTRYEILEEAGRGAMGIVYKARDVQTNDIVAVKVLHPAIASESGLIERFKNELLLARRITHKNVCRVHDLNDFGGAIVIAMEFVDGESLRDVLKRADGVSIRHGLKIARQVIAGVGEAHAQGVIHRDLKPANILVGRDGHVTVMDFGIARSVDSRDTSTGLIVGTPAYMSPEQAEGRQPDARSDIYSLGVVTYELFCGQPVFTADSTAALVAKHVNETPRSPRELEPDLPIRIERAILKCLEKSPEKRFQSVAELDAALAEEPAVRLTTRALEEAPLPLHLTRWQRSDVLLVAAAVVGVLVFLPCFAQTSLAPRSPISFDRSLLRRIVGDHLQRLGITVGRERDFNVYAYRSPYIYLAKEHGFSAARALANDPVFYLSWELAFPDGIYATVNNRGDLLTYFRTSVPATGGVSQPQDAKGIAEKALADVWEQQASGLVVERSSGGGQIDSFTWLNPSAPRGLQERYIVNVDAKGISYLWKSFIPPLGYQATLPASWGGPVAAVLALIGPALGFLHRRRVDPAARWRTTLCILAFLAFGGSSWFLSSFSYFNDKFAWSFGSGLIGAGGWLLGSIALETQIGKTQAPKMYTLMWVCGRRVLSEPCGLAILRGALVGLALLGIDAVAIWVATEQLGAYLDPYQHIYVLGRTLNGAESPVAAVLALGGMQALGIGSLVALVGSVSERVLAQAWMRGVIPAALLAISGVHLSMASIQPFYWTIILLFIDYFILVLTFRRFDLLTLFTAILTFAFCWANYPLLVMQQPIGPVWPLTAFVMWGLLVAVAAMVTFQSTLGPAYKRMAASLE